jgi:hypothetical protein
MYTPMKDIIPTHFLILSVGEVLKTDLTVNPQTLQNFVATQTMFEGIRPTLEECDTVLGLMEMSGLLMEVDLKEYAHMWGIEPAVAPARVESPNSFSNTEEDKYLAGLLDEIDRARERGRKTVFRISDKVLDGTVMYVKNYFSANPDTNVTAEFKKCQSCNNVWDIIITLK